MSGYFALRSAFVNGYLRFFEKLFTGVDWIE